MSLLPQNVFHRLANECLHCSPTYSTPIMTPQPGIVVLASQLPISVTECVKISQNFNCVKMIGRYTSTRQKFILICAEIEVLGN